MLYQRAACVTIVTIHSLSVHSDQLKDQVDLVEGYTVGSMAVQNDRLVGEAWVGHPYYELIDNSTDTSTHQVICHDTHPTQGCVKRNIFKHGGQVNKQVRL